MGQELVEKFDNLVKELANPQIYEAYHQMVLEHMNGQTSVEYFRMQIFDLFQDSEIICNELSRFFIHNQETERKPAVVEEKQQISVTPKQEPEPTP